MEVGVTAEEETIRQEVLALSASIAFRRRNYDVATRLCSEAAARIVRTGVSFPLYYWTVFMVAEVMIGLRLQSDGDPGELERWIARIHRVLKREARVHKVAEPSYLLAEGYRAFFGGRTDAAHNAWREAKTLAARLQLAREAKYATWLLTTDGWASNVGRGRLSATKA